MSLWTLKNSAIIGQNNYLRIFRFGAEMSGSGGTAEEMLDQAFRNFTDLLKTVTILYTQGTVSLFLTEDLSASRIVPV